jgi:hypothetical protein
LSDFTESTELEHALQAEQVSDYRSPGGR